MKLELDNWDYDYANSEKLTIDATEDNYISIAVKDGNGSDVEMKVYRTQVKHIHSFLGTYLDQNP